MTAWLVAILRPSEANQRSQAIDLCSLRTGYRSCAISWMEGHWSSQIGTPAMGQGPAAASEENDYCFVERRGGIRKRKTCLRGPFVAWSIGLGSSLKSPAKSP